MSKLRIEEVAIFTGVSVNTINSWYRFKKQNPEDEYAKMLPDYTQDGGDRSVRYWNEADIDKLLQFKDMKPAGRAGVMGNVTQKYVKKENKNGKETVKNK